MMFDFSSTEVSSHNGQLQHLSNAVINVSCVLSPISSDGVFDSSFPNHMRFFSLSLSAQGTERGFYGNEEETMVSFSAESSSCQRGRER